MSLAAKCFTGSFIYLFFLNHTRFSIFPYKPCKCDIVIEVCYCPSDLKGNIKKKKSISKCDISATRLFLISTVMMAICHDHSFIFLDKNVFIAL